MAAKKRASAAMSQVHWLSMARPRVAIRANWGASRVHQLLTRGGGPTPCSGSGVWASCQTHCGQWHNRFCFNLGEPPANQSAEVPDLELTSSRPPT